MVPSNQWMRLVCECEQERISTRLYWLDIQLRDSCFILSGASTWFGYRGNYEDEYRVRNNNKIDMEVNMVPFIRHF
jgi:hypothetical protein